MQDKPKLDQQVKIDSLLHFFSMNCEQYDPSHFTVPNIFILTINDNNNIIIFIIIIIIIKMYYHVIPCIKHIKNYYYMFILFLFHLILVITDHN